MTLTTKVSTMPVASHLKIMANQIYTYTKHLLNDSQDEARVEKLTPFGSCLVNVLSSNNDIESKHVHIKDNHETYVNCELVNNKLILSKALKEDIESSFDKDKKKLKRKAAGTLKLRHFELCPAKDMSDEQRQRIPESVLMRNIGVAVAVILGILLILTFFYFPFFIFISLVGRYIIIPIFYSRNI